MLLWSVLLIKNAWLDQKISIPSPWMVIGNSEGGGGGGRGVLKTKFFKGILFVNLNWNFQRGRVARANKPSVGEYSVFINETYL